MTDIGALTIVELAAVIEGFATGFAAIFAFVGISMVYVQIRGQRAIQREATAMGLFREYLREAIERPDLASPDYDQIKQQGNRADIVRYELFVANMLYSFDEVLLGTQSKDWRAVVRGELARHADYLRSAEFQKQRGYYAPEITAIIDAVRADALPKPA
ncbi:hypothetical protein [Bauldia sp.]|uniref:hypothetical protein n=1 Tax=Bauldia sp. TaxID=2575872 RepID=UPI003BACC25C